MSRRLIICAFIFGFIQSYSQQSISGRIIDQSTGEVIPGVNIHIPYSLIGTSTDQNGRFGLKIPVSTQKVLLSSIGYHSKTILTSNINQLKVIGLEPQTMELSSVNIQSSIDKKWKQQFKKFRREFIGSSKQAKKCKILNPWVIDFEKPETGGFSATAEEPIIIENKATGYLVQFHLEKFNKKGGVIIIAGIPYFANHMSEDNVIKSTQQRKRKSTYEGSKAHFLFALTHNKLDQHGFEIYHASQDPISGQFVTKKELKRYQIFKDQTLTSTELIKVVYTKEEDESVSGSATLPANGGMTGSTVSATAFQTSYLELLSPSIILGENGVPLRPNQLVDYGYWHRDRVAEFLPSEYLPNDFQSNTNKPIIKIQEQGQDSKMNNFKLTELKIPINEIKRGGPPRDGIPSIDQPNFDKALDSKLSNNQRVLGVTFNGISKAYPINIMNWHEIVNDVFDDHPVVITYCPLCGSGIAFDASVDNQPTTFGVSGLLFNSDVLLYDRQSESLWSQIEMMGISGPKSGKALVNINTSNTSWKAWKNEHPNTLVLSEQTGFERNYKQSPYTAYEQSDQLMFPVNKSNAELANKELVIGVNIGDEYKAYPLSALKKHKDIISDQIANTTIFIEYDKPSHSAKITDLIGNTIPSVQLYWFAWYAFHPTTLLFK